MNKPPIFFFFIIAMVSFLITPSLFPSLRLLTFTPFLALFFQRTPLLPSLWFSSFCGLLIDILSSDTRLGVFALCYVVTTFCTHRFRHHFFVDNPLSIPLYTLLISTFLSLIQALVILPVYAFNLAFICTTFVLMPLMDALYALLLFTSFMFLYRLFLLRKQGAL